MSSRGPKGPGQVHPLPLIPTEQVESDRTKFQTIYQTELPDGRYRRLQQPRGEHGPPAGADDVQHLHPALHDRLVASRVVCKLR